MYSEIQIGKLFPSPLNPRRSVDQTRLDELQASISEHGIIEPLVVRKNGARFEIICGSRRYTAALAADLAEVPVVVRKLTDVAALEMALIENVQDEELHALDEAAGYEALLKAGAGKTTHASIGQKVGKTPSHVFKRCQLLKLAAPVRTAFAANRITIRHAERLTRVPNAKQAAALEQCFAPLFHSEDSEPAPVAHLDEWIARHVKEELDDASVVHVFPELLDQVDSDHPEDAIPELIGLSESHHAGSDLDDRKHGLVNAGAWAEIRSERERCENARQGVVLHGGRVRVLEVCVKKGCKKHRPPRPKSTAAAVRKETKREAAVATEQIAAERRRQDWDRDKPKLLACFVDHVKGAKVTPALVEAFLGWQLETTKKIIGKVTAANMGQAMSVAVLMAGQTYDLASFKKRAAQFGFSTTAAMKAIRSSSKHRAPTSGKATTKTSKGRSRKKAKRKPAKGAGWGASAGR